MRKTHYPALSYWEKEVWFRPIDVLIVGGGIVGLNAARKIKQEHKDLRVLVLERGSLPAGASTRNAGFACFGSLTELLSDRVQIGNTAMFDLVAKRYEGLRRMREKLGDKLIGYQEWGGYELFQDSEVALFDTCREEMIYFNQQLRGITGVTETYQDASNKCKDFGFGGIRHLILNRAEGQIHTGKMMFRLESMVRDLGVKIINGLSVTSLEDQSDEVVIQTNQGWEIKAKKVIVATNGFARHLFPQALVQPARNQVLITTPIPGLSVKGCFHYDQGYYYFRNIDQRILLGGGRNLAIDEEMTDEFGFHTQISERLLALLQSVILPGQKIEIDQRWSGIMGVGREKKPIIRQVSPRVTIAVRLGGMGVAIGNWVGEEAASMSLGKVSNEGKN